MANRIPSRYVPIVRNSLIASAGIAPLGLLGSLDTVAVAATWATMFYAIRENAGSSLGANPKRICSGVASGIAKYYIGCKVASYTCFLIPGVGPILATGVSGICNIYFTYSFAATLIELFSKPTYNDEEIIHFFIRHLKKLPDVEEVKEIINIYQS